MEQDEYRPREDDHLVEPMFAGLGVGEDREDDASADDEERAEETAVGFLMSLRRFLRRLFS